MKYFTQILILTLTAVFVAACESTSTTTPLSTTVRPPTVVSEMPASLPTASPSPQPTGTETSVPADQPETNVATAAPTSQATTSETQIRVIIGDRVLTGRLWDNATARNLVAQLPLTLTFSDFNGLEKITALPQELSIDGVPAGDDPLPGDIGYYAPAGDLVFYYGDVGYFNGIVRIGQFDGSMDAITSQTGDFTARIELVE